MGFQYFSEVVINSLTL